MRKSGLARVLALVMGVWLSLVQSDAGLFHACSTGNDAVAAFAAAAAGTSTSSRAVAEAHDSHAEHASGAAHRHIEAPAAPPAHQHGSGDDECHCIGHCCVTTVPALRAPDTFALVSVVQVDVVQPGRASHAVLAQWTDYVLPFSTAPPIVIVG